MQEGIPPQKVTEDGLLRCREANLKQICALAATCDSRLRTNKMKVPSALTRAPQATP
jgi:hypothetical protein